MKNTLSSGVLLLCTEAFVGCAGPGAPKHAADDGEYEYVTPVGSNIPVRVRKGQTATSTTSPTATMSGEQAANMLHGAGGQTSGTAGRGTP
jgi:hypothetical protein